MARVFVNRFKSTLDDLAMKKMFYNMDDYMVQKCEFEKDLIKLTVIDELGTGAKRVLTLKPVGWEEVPCQPKRKP
jgi:hypothetical protein